jgi:hypothetical protein
MNTIRFAKVSSGDYGAGVPHDASGEYVKAGDVANLAATLSAMLDVAARGQAANVGLQSQGYAALAAIGWKGGAR